MNVRSPHCDVRTHRNNHSVLILCRERHIAQSAHDLFLPCLRSEVIAAVFLGPSTCGRCSFFLFPRFRFEGARFWQIRCIFKRDCARPCVGQAPIRENRSRDAPLRRLCVIKRRLRGDCIRLRVNFAFSNLNYRAARVHIAAGFVQFARNYEPRGHQGKETRVGVGVGEGEEIITTFRDGAVTVC